MENKIVWIACRAAEKCQGQQCEQIRHTRTVGGGHITHYRCLTCKRKFSVRV